jgi:hypothetical protein
MTKYCKRWYLGFTSIFSFWSCLFLKSNVILKDSFLGIEMVRIMNNSLYTEVSIQYNGVPLYRRHMSDVQGKRVMHK